MDKPRVGYAEQVRRKRILYGVLAGIAVILVTWGFFSLERAAKPVEASSLWIEEVQRGEMLREVRGPGTLVPESIRWIPALTDGRVEDILVKPGAEVTPETVILELSNPGVEQASQDARLALSAAQADYEDLKVQLESSLLAQQASAAAVEADFQGALLDAESSEELAKDGLISDVELRKARIRAEQLKNRHEIEKNRLAKAEEGLEAQLGAQRARLQQARALYDLRQRELDSLRVRATIEGVLQQVPLEEGQQVTPGTNLARVAQPDELKAELRIAETQAKDIVVGQLAKVDTRNGVVEGRVSRIDPASQDGTVTVDVELVGDLPRGARPQLNVDGVIEIERLDDVLYVGRPAYGQANSRISLFRLTSDGNEANRVPVQLGRSSVNTFEILEGLQQGDRVILSDTSQHDDTDKLRLR